MPGHGYRQSSVGSDALRAAVESALSGRGSLVFVTGEPGIGKTTSAQDAAAEASAAGAEVLWAACWQDDTTAHAPWRSVLTAIGDVGEAALAALSGTDDLDPTAAGAARAGAYARVVDALAAESRRRPLVVVLDDLHWADDGTVRLLGALRGALAASSLLVVGTYRDNEVPLDSPLAMLAAAADRIALTPFAPRAVADLIAGLIGREPDEGTVADVLRRTGGNPFLVLQVARLLSTEHGDVLPAGARDVLLRRLDALPADVRTTLEAAAVLGGSFGPSTIGRILSRSAENVLGQLDVSTGARITRSSGTPGEWEFVHDLFRQAALDSLPSARRSELHRIIAGVLIDDEANAATIAHHALGAAVGPDVDAAEWALRAAADDLDAFAWDNASAYAEHALAVLPSGADADPLRAEAWLVFGQARLLSGDRDRAVAAFSTAAALGRSLDAPEVLARAALGFAADLGGFEVTLFDQRQIDLLEDAATALALKGDPTLRARVLARLSVALSFAAPTERRLALAEQAVALARSAGDPSVLAHALAAHCDAIAGPDDIERRQVEAAEIIELAVTAGDRGTELLGRRLRFVALLEAADVVSAHAEMSAFARRAAEVGNPLYSWYVPLWRGMWALAAGDVVGAEEASDEVARIGLRAGSSNAPMLATVLRAEMLFQSARFDEMVPLTEQISLVMGELADSPQAVGNMSRLLHAIGRRVEAVALLDRLQSTGLETIPLDAEWLPAIATVVDAARMLDHPILERAVDVARGSSDCFAIEGIGGVLHGSIARFVADGLVALGRREEAVPYARRALESNRAAGALLAAHAQRTLASALVDDDEARELHATADATFRGLGLHHFVRSDSGQPDRPVGDAELCRRGDVWHVSFAGTSTIVKHSKGMQDLATLLARPRHEVHVTELEALPPAVAAAARGSSRHEALDRQAVAAYRARLAELDEDLADAESANDIVRAERTRSERDFLLDELSSSIGLGGRARSSGPDPVERLRKAVTARVRDAIRRIETAHPELSRHLSNSVRTGTYCSYQPERPVVWHCEPRSGA